MKKTWNSWLKEAVFIYSIIYTITTIVNSIAYLIQGIRYDPSGNWYELTRALIVLIGVIAYELARHLPIKNIFLRTVIVYVVTLACAFFTVSSTQFVEPLAKSAYKDIFINYTGLFIVITIIIVIFQKIKHKK
ncbi:hypothetical protein HMPREF9629_01233 [Peptoanaerobacter stomatis]|uniref:Uncharacterized protein n=1 Tax=Peptoanaerobacter stomatis TaxID=796937 RepID=G9WYI2_9FIRM|nr:DUF6608 family protein [Peptoanaerobacter stomatis]EHL16393.1 hypothetical protein HMPREF9629_01233 [Peptoanaerobacter stomatis]